MNRIDELERTIANRKDNIETSQRFLEKEEKELAALKAEREKTREWQMFLSPAGCLVPMKYFMQSLGNGGMVECAPITVIEKKPLVVTREMALLLQEVWYSTSANIISPKLWTAIFKAAGIEARAGDD